MPRVLPSFLLALCCIANSSSAAAAKTPSAQRDPEALRVVEVAAGHFERAALVEADVAVADGHVRLRREDGVGVEIQAHDRNVLIRHERIWTRADASAEWILEKAPPVAAAQAFADLDRTSVPLTAAALRARAATASSVRDLGLLPDEDGCAVRGVLIESADVVPGLVVELELRVCADDLHPVGARLRRPGGASPGPYEDAVYTLQADGQLPDPDLR